MKENENRRGKTERSVGRVIGWGFQCFWEVPHFPAPSVPGSASWKSRLCQTAPTRSQIHRQQGLRHLFQTTAQCDPLHALTTNHTVSDDVVNLLLQRFPPSDHEPQLTCAAEDDDNEKGWSRKRGGGKGGPDWTWRLKPGDGRKTEAHEQGHAPPFQSDAGVSHGSRASRGEAPSWILIAPFSPHCRVFLCKSVQRGSCFIQGQMYEVKCE